MITPKETMIIMPEETNKERRGPGRPPKNADKRDKRFLCGFGRSDGTACDTYYEDANVMQKHRERVHGEGVANRNVPRQRDNRPLEAPQDY